MVEGMYVVVNVMLSITLSLDGMLLSEIFRHFIVTTVIWKYI